MKRPKRKRRVRSAKKTKLFKKRVKRFIILNIIIVLMAYVFYYVEVNIKPMVEKIADVKTREIASKTINEAIYEEATHNILKNLVSIEKDKQGRVVIAQPNASSINKVSAKTQILVQKKLNNIKSQDISIPAGSLFKAQLISNIGPQIRVKMALFGTVSVNYHTEFIANGINQTKYKAFLTIKAKLQAYISIFRTYVEIEEKVPVAETIIVGPTPGTYVNVPSADSALNLVDGGDSKVK